MKKIFSVSLAVATFACTLGFSGCTKLEDASWNPEVFEFTYVQYPLSSNPELSDKFIVGRDKNQNVYLNQRGDLDFTMNDELTNGDALVYVAKQQVGVNETQSFDVYQSDDAGSDYSLINSTTTYWSDIIEDKSYYDVYQMITKATWLADNGATYEEVDTLQSVALLGDDANILTTAGCTFYSFNDGEQECAVVKTDDGSTQATVYHAIRKDDGGYSIQFTCASIKIDHDTNYANLVK